MLECAHLRAGYAKKEVLHDLCLSLQPGLLYVLIGPNGSGKSTLLSVLGGWKKPYDGSVRLDGQDLVSMPPMKKAGYTGRIDAHHAGSMRVCEFVLAGRYHKHPWPQNYDSSDRHMAKQAMDAMKITDLSERRINTLSAGQKQKAAIAQILCQDPQVMLLDEPDSSLDPAARFELGAHLQQLRDDRRIVAAVLHDLDISLRFADLLLVLDRGSLVFCGTPGQLVAGSVLEEVFHLKILDWDPETKTGRIFPQ